MAKELIYFKTYGCQMNVDDSERMLTSLADMKMTEQVEQADVILFNTCTVREKAKHKVLSALGELKELKKQRPEIIIGIAGCMAQEEGENLLHKYPHLDLVFGPDQINKVPAYIEKIRQTRFRLTDVGFDEGDVFSLPSLKSVRFNSISNFVTIIKGCNKYCSFCIVPFVRGMEKSRSPEEILQEISMLVQTGTREITLLGQNVNSYDYKGINFVHLLKLVNDVSGVERIRFTSSHPMDVTEELISLFGSLSHLCEHFHLPAQSGSDRVLWKMNRKYTRAKYIEHVQKLRMACPEISITTDLIVGYPGEEEEDFEQTLSLMREIGYDGSYSFKYSPRVGTPAARVADKVSEEIKTRRLQELQDLQKELTYERNRALLGTRVEVLVDQILPVGFLLGRTRTNKMVQFQGAPSLLGKTVSVDVMQAKSNHLNGALAA